MFSLETVGLQILIKKTPAEFAGVFFKLSVKI